MKDTKKEIGVIVNSSITNRRDFIRLSTNAAIVLASISQFAGLAVNAEAAEVATLSKNEGADVIYLNGKVYTVDNSMEWAEAFAVKDGKFISVGTNKDIESLKREKTKVVDLKGQFVMPGFIEGHAHPLRGQLMESVDFSLIANPVPTFETFKKTLLDYAAAHPHKEWIVGGAFNWDTFKNAGLTLNAQLIDSIIKDRPVTIEDETGHIVVCNSKAFEMAGITKDTKDPVGGYFGKNKKGSLNGIIKAGSLNGFIYETAMMPLYSHIPNYKPKEVYDAGEKIFARYNSMGFTALRIAQGDELWLKSIAKLDHDHKLKMQIDCAPYVNDFYRGYSNEYIFDELDKFGSKHLKITSVKIIADGQPFGKTMWVKKPYPNTKDNYGVPTLNPKTLIDQIVKYNSKGIRVFVHCTGDGAISGTLDGIEKAMKINGAKKIRKLRNQIAHSVVVDPNDYSRVVNANAIMEFGPVFWYPQPLVKQSYSELDAYRIEHFYPVRQTLDNGIHIAIGSDWNQTKADPFLNAETLVTRREPGAPKDAPMQNPTGGISLKEAIHAYTMGGAYCMMMEDEMGSITKGKKANFAVLSQNIFEIPINKVHKTFAKQTYFEGELIYEGDEKVSF